MKQNIRDFMAEFNFHKGYSRWIEESGRPETWNEAVERVMNMHREKYADIMSPELEEEIKFAEDAYKDKLVLGSQRALQYGGPQIFQHNARIYNCTATYADRPEFFGETFYLLLCGCGVGVSVQKHHVESLPPIQERKKQAKTFVVPDSIEGWAQALDVLLSSYFVGGGKHPEFEGRKVFFDLTKIRPRGAPVSGGFKAPGPEGLRRALDRIELLLQTIVLKEGSRKLKPIDVYDIIMHTSDAVLSGGIRRSACIVLFSKDDEEMMKAKTGNWFKENPQRARSNNSVVLKRDDVAFEEFREIIENIKEFGEPGFFFVDDFGNATNPCCEIGFYPQIDGKTGFGFCNLTEINGGKCVDEKIFQRACRAATIIGTLQAGYTDFKFVNETTKKIVEKEALLGVSVTGWLENPDVLLDENVMRRGVETIKETNEKIAKMIGINPAARLTCTKPSGNASVLLSTASGIHPDHARKFIRNIQLNKDSEIAKIFMEKFPEMIEESVWSANGTDIVVSFPIEVESDTAIFKTDVKDIDLLEIVKKVQENWVLPGKIVERCINSTVNHNVSNTITVTDWDGVTKYIYDNREYFTGISLLPDSGDKVFNQAPFVAINDPEALLEKYGIAAMFASGLIVDGITAFGNLWDACHAVQNEGLLHDLDGLRKDWVRRFRNFADRYLGGDIILAEECLKECHLLHKFESIKRRLEKKEDIDWVEEIKTKKEVNLDTIGAMSCSGGACEII